MNKTRILGIINNLLLELYDDGLLNSKGLDEVSWSLSKNIKGD